MACLPRTELGLPGHRGCPRRRGTGGMALMGRINVEIQPLVLGKCQRCSSSDRGGPQQGFSWDLLAASELCLSLLLSHELLLCYRIFILLCIGGQAGLMRSSLGCQVREGWRTRQVLSNLWLMQRLCPACAKAAWVPAVPPRPLHACLQVKACPLPGPLSFWSRARWAASASLSPQTLPTSP